MNQATISTPDFEDTLQMWEWGKHCRTAWMKTKYPEWVRQMTGRRADEEKNLSKYLVEIDPDYADRLEKSILKLPRLTRDVLVHIYVNRLQIREIAKDLHISQGTVHKERDTALAILYGRLFDTDLNSL